MVEVLGGRLRLRIRRPTGEQVVGVQGLGVGVECGSVVGGTSAVAHSGEFRVMAGSIRIREE